MTKCPIIHVELPTKNRDAGAKFYAKLFGWTYQHSDQPAPYTLFDTGSIKIGMPDAGEDHQPGSVVFYIHSDDLAAI